MAGRPPKEKSFANMLKIALSATGKTGEPKLREVAEVLVDQALAGEGWAIKEIADRTDGKVAQAIVGDDEHDAIAIVHRIERAIVRPAD
jgi:hypothetical protein